MQHINRAVLFEQLTGAVLSQGKKIVADISGVYQRIFINRFIRHRVLVQRRIQQIGVLL